MPVEAVAGLAEAFVPLMTALIEVMFLAVQLAAVAVELLINVVVALVSAIIGRFSKQPSEPRPTLSAKMQATLKKRFGSSVDCAGTVVEPSDKPSLWNPFTREPTLPFEWNRRHTIALGILLGLIAAILIAVILLWGKRFDVVVTQEEIQQAVAARFPKSKTIMRVEVTLRNPAVRLDDKADRITSTIECAVRVSGVPVEATGKLIASGRLEYRPRDAGFYMQDVTIDWIDLVGIPQRLEELGKEGVTKVAREFLEAIPVYRLKDDRWQDHATKLVLRKVRVEEGVLKLSMGIGD